MTAEEIMTAAPVTTSPRATLRQALRLLQQLELRHLPVVDDGRLVGMLSDRDFRTALGHGFEDGNAPKEDLDASVASLMTSEVLCVPPDAPLSELIDLMVEHHVGAIPVAADSDDALLGIVSYVDVLRVARDRL